VKTSFKPTLILAVLAALWVTSPLPALACATCYGASDSPMAQGMNWGIVTLLGFIGSVLATLVVFFVYLARRSARFQAAEQSQLPTDQPA